MMDRTQKVWLTFGAAAALALIGLQVAVSTGNTTWDEIGSLVLVSLLTALAAAAYLVPTIVAAARKHHSMGGIIALNLLTGWTFIGWLIAFVWSLSDPSPTVRLQQIQSAPVAYQAGDVVNGHRFNGQDWTPVS